MTLTEIDRRIEAAEQRERYFDAAEGRQWFSERVAAAANRAELTLLRAKQKYQSEAVDDWRGLECTEALDACDREACRKLLGRPA